MYIADLAGEFVDWLNKPNVVLEVPKAPEIPEEIQNVPEIEQQEQTVFQKTTPNGVVYDTIPGDKDPNK